MLEPWELTEDDLDKVWADHYDDLPGPPFPPATAAQVKLALWVSAGSPDADSGDSVQGRMNRVIAWAQAGDVPRNLVPISNPPDFGWSEPGAPR